MTYPLQIKPGEQRYWDKSLETQSRGQWDALKLILLRKHLRHAYEGSPYYKASFDAAGVHYDKVQSLADLRHFPLPRATHKAKRVEDRRTGVWG